MKKKEIAQFEIEFLEFDKYKNRRLGDRKFFLVELQNYISIVDVLGNQQFNKIYLSKGQGNHRIDDSDVFDMEVQLWSHDGFLVDEVK